MTQQPDDVAIYLDSADVTPPPTWDEMREDGCMVADEPTYKVAVYAGGLECVILRTEDDEGGLHHAVLGMHLIPALIAALAKSMVEAEIKAHIAHAEVEVWQAAEKALQAPGAQG